MEMREAINLCEMSYSRKKADAVITGFERPLNEHLLKLILVDDPQNRPHWLKEVGVWMEEIAEIRLKPNHKPAPASFYFGILYDEPFGGTAAQNIGGRVRRLGQAGYVIGEIPLPEVIRRLKGFHEAFATLCANGQGDRISELLAKL